MRRHYYNTTDTICHSEILTREPRRLVDFGTVDNKGRKIGCAIDLREIECSPIPGARSGMLHDPGRYLIAEVTVTRDGVPFGRSQIDAEFKTVEDRDAYVERRIAGSRKAMLKKFGVPAAS